MECLWERKAILCVLLWCWIVHVWCAVSLFICVSVSVSGGWREMHGVLGREVGKDVCVGDPCEAYAACIYTYMKRFFGHFSRLGWRDPLVLGGCNWWKKQIYER